MLPRSSMTVIGLPSNSTPNIAPRDAPNASKRLHDGGCRRCRADRDDCRHDNIRPTFSGAEHASRSQQYGEISERIDAQVFVGNDLDDAVAFQLAIGPAREVYRESGKLAEGRHEEIANALKTALAKYRRPNGVIMDSSSWKVTGRNPG